VDNLADPVDIRTVLWTTGWRSWIWRRVPSTASPPVSPTSPPRKRL